ncbi:HAD family hydrolase [Lysinibacillus endophyticus]|uniref:HAD family hydrolase n=1 Tax=Ureibacillus endophyticus TaxID=1978490 RepID=UPI0020A113DC|nr:HAD family hydrolase [Lysinibacillus endophyticus]MCP1143963.1 HAD family hydrolase [Lysinibacillus endophyticus]
MQNDRWVFFDKDGTLIDLFSIWIPWSKFVYFYITNSLEQSFSLSEREFIIKLGVNEDEISIDITSPLAIGSILESQIIVAFILYENGIGWDKAMTIAKEGITFANEQKKFLEVKALPGVYDLLEELKKHGVKMGVITADVTSNATYMLEKVKLSHYFEFIYGSDLVENSKPSPDLAFLASERHQIDLSKVLMIGDSNADMSFAKNAGLAQAICINSTGQTNLSIFPEADVIIEKYDQQLVDRILESEG